MKIFIEATEEKKEVDFKGKAKDLLNQLQINPVTVVLVRNGKLITEDELLENDDEIELLAVVSGG